MLVRYSYIEKLAPIFRALKSRLLTVVGRHPQASTWHTTRVLEYPWALFVAPPKGKILDVGTNEQFGFSLLPIEEVSSVVLHYTDWDIHRIGQVGGEGPNIATPIESGSDPFRRYTDKLSLVVGYFDRLPLQPNYFDIIYCISTLEHVYPEDYDSWFFGLWELLKPGGTMVITTDHYLDYPLEGGDKSFGHNHDLKRRIFCTLGVQPNNDDECPWNKDYSKLDSDVVVHVGEYGRLCVYGCTLRKPQ